MVRIERFNPLIIVIAIFLVYLPAITSDYAYRDDYNQLYRIINNSNIFPANTLIEGRPGYWLLLTLIYPMMDSFQDFNYLRFMNVSFISVFALMLYNCYENANWPKSWALLAALITISFPAFGVIAGWAGTFQIILGLIIGMLAGMLSLKESYKLSALALITSLCFYQISAMVFWLPLLIAVINPKNIDTKIIYRTKQFLVVFILTLLAYTILFKLGLHIYAPIINEMNLGHKIGRASVTFNMFEKFIWFIKIPFTDSLNLFLVDKSVYLSAISGLTILLGFSSYFKKQGCNNKNTRLAVGLVLFAIPVSMLPMFFVPENNAEFRIQIVLSAFVAYLLLFSIYTLTKLLSEKDNKLFLMIMIAGAIGALSMAGSQLKERFIKTQVGLIERTQAQLKNIDANKTIYYEVSNNSVWKRNEYANFHMVPKAFLHLLYWDMVGNKKKLKILPMQGNEQSFNAKDDIIVRIK